MIRNPIGKVNKRSIKLSLIFREATGTKKIPAAFFAAGGFGQDQYFLDSSFSATSRLISPELHLAMI